MLSEGMRKIYQSAGLFMLVAFSDPANARFCKWVDENGVTHYAENCPEDVISEAVEIQPPPTREQVEEAATRSKSLTESRHTSGQSADQDRASRSGPARSLSLEELGPLPENSSSMYLTTLGADYLLGINVAEAGKNNAQFVLRLRAKDNLLRGAFLEARFPNPAKPGQKLIVGKKLNHKGGEVLLTSPKSGGFKCWNYEVEVHVYQDDSKQQLLDIHRQVIQSRVDFSLDYRTEDLVVGLAGGGTCPSPHQREMKKMNVEQLEALCERERQNRLAPERKKLIERCIEGGIKSPDQCERFYADWGDAMRLDRLTMRKSLYYDLPECIAAQKAREGDR